VEKHLHIFSENTSAHCRVIQKFHNGILCFSITVS
jgi:hypothetical protein